MEEPEFASRRESEATNNISRELKQDKRKMTLNGVPSENGQWSTLKAAVNAQLSPCCKSILLAMAQCAEGGSALARSRPRVTITTATADSRKEKPSNSSAAGYSRVGTLSPKYVVASVTGLSGLGAGLVSTVFSRSSLIRRWDRFSYFPAFVAKLIQEVH